MCEAGLSTLGIMPNGSVLPCSMFLSELPFGNIRTDDIEKIWESDSAEAFRKKYKFSGHFPHDECIHCENNILRHMPWHFFLEF